MTMRLRMFGELFDGCKVMGTTSRNDLGSHAEAERQRRRANGYDDRQVEIVGLLEAHHSGGLIAIPTLGDLYDALNHIY